MLKQLWFGYLHGVNTPAGFAWYYNTHAKEFVRWFGPWLRRYETYVASVPPNVSRNVIQTFGIVPGRYTEIWWTDKEEFVEANSLDLTKPYTQLPGGYTPEQIFGALTISQARPDHDFLRKEPNPASPIIRWVRALKYPASIKKPDEWYLSDYVPAVIRKTGDQLLRYVSYKTVDEDLIHDPFIEKFDRWDRVDELWFPDFSFWQTAFGAASESGFEKVISNFVTVQPDQDFLRA